MKDKPTYQVKIKLSRNETGGSCQERLLLYSTSVISNFRGVVVTSCYFARLWRQAKAILFENRKSSPKGVYFTTLVLGK